MKAFLEKLAEENKNTKEQLSQVNKSIKSLTELSVDSHKASKVTNVFLTEVSRRTREGP